MDQTNLAPVETLERVSLTLWHPATIRSCSGRFSPQIPGRSEALYLAGTRVAGGEVAACLACLYVCLFVYSCSASEAPVKVARAAVAVRRRFRLKAVRGELVNSAWDRGDSIIPIAQHKDPLLWCSVVFLSNVWGWPHSPKSSRSAYYTNIYVSFIFSCWFFLPSGFMSLTKGVLSVNSDCPPALFLNQSFGHITHASSCQVNNFGCGVGLDSPSCLSNM